MRKKTTIKVYKQVNIIIVFLFIIIFIKLAFVVLSPKVDGISLKEKSASITTANKVIPAYRGNIYSSNGDTLATNVNSYTLIAYLSPNRTVDSNNPQHVVDKNLTASMLAPILDMSEDSILKFLNKDAYQVEFGPKGKNLTDLTKKKIEDLELPGIDFITNIKRYYNMSAFASYLIGYAKVDEDDKIKGELGIEKYYDDILAGKDGYKKYQKYTSSDYQIPNTPSQVIPASNGKNIYLTIDSNIQLIAEKAISEYENYKSDWAIVTVMDAKTGAILASSTSPNFNPNDTNTIKNYMNPLVSFQYEPGSVMKIFSFATAINEGLYNGNEKYLSGSIDVADKTIRDANRKGWGEITYDTGFAYSSNVAATNLALRLGAGKLTDYYNKLGFGSKTGIELSNEVKGIIDINNPVTLASAAFGQGITVTPIQLLQAATTITNDGVLLKPYVVQKIVDDKNKVTYKGKRTVINDSVYKKETVNKMEDLMQMVIYDSLTNMWQVPGLRLMGKTGTAQIVSPHGGYRDGKYDYIKSFLAIFPVEDPQYIVYFAAKRPKTSARNFANVATTAIEEIAGYSKLFDKNNTSSNKLFKVDNYISKNINDVKERLNNKNITPIIIGDGKYVIDQFPSKNKNLPYNGKLFILTNGDNYYMPDISGWSRAEVDNYCKLANLNCSFSGYGYVINQSILKDTLINADDLLKIELK